jgi:triacylglycerol lipase
MSNLSQSLKRRHQDANVRQVKTPTAAYLCPEGFRGPQGLAIFNEASVAMEATHLVARRLRDGVCARRPEVDVDTNPVLMVPGFMAGDYTLRALKRHLREQGHRTYCSQIRSNSSCLAETAERLESRLEAIAAKHSSPVTLIGHSLGGLLSRGLAARRPDLVGGVVTMGSPLLAPTAVHPLLLLDIQILLTLQRHGIGRFMSADCTSGECAQAMWQEAQLPISEELPFYSIYSRRDGIMDWRACLDPAAEHIEVRSSHCGMALDPSTFDVVTDALADITGRSRRRSMSAVS